MIFHTSPQIITTVKNGLFGKAVCFASSPYFMSARPSDCWIYSLDTSDLKIIEAGHIFFDDEWRKAVPVVVLLMERFEIDEESARNLLDQTTDVFTLISGADTDDDFWVQQQRYEAAVLMGYDGVEQQDEQGAMWMFSVEKIIEQTPVSYSEQESYE